MPSLSLQRTKDDDSIYRQQTILNV